MNNMKRDEIWVICDRHDNCSYEHLKQMIGKASELGKKASYSVVVVCIGEMTKEQCEELFCYGADKVLLFIRKRICKLFTSDN